MARDSFQQESLEVWDTYKRVQYHREYDDDPDNDYKILNRFLNLPEHTS